jgi:hypothetical protein
MLWVVLSVLYSLDPRDCYTNLPKLVEKCIGDHITITPDFVGYPSTPQLDWTNIPGDGRHKVHQNGTLVISNAQLEDSELYSYLVHSEDEFTLAFFNLSVTDCRNLVDPTPAVTTSDHTKATSTVRDVTSSTIRDIKCGTPDPGKDGSPRTQIPGATTSIKNIECGTPTSGEDTSKTRESPPTSRVPVPSTPDKETSPPTEKPASTPKNTVTSPPTESRDTSNPTELPVSSSTVDISIATGNRGLLNYWFATGNWGLLNYWFALASRPFSFPVVFLINDQ